MEIKSIEHNKKDLISRFKTKNSMKAFIDDFYKIIVIRVVLDFLFRTSKDRYHISKYAIYFFIEKIPRNNMNISYNNTIQK